jgi:hypothetical protein
LRLVDIGHGGEFGIVVGFQSLGGGSRATAAAADQADFDGIGDGLGGDDGRKSGDSDGTGGFQKIAPLGLE